MAHVMKLKAGAVAPMVAHYERVPELERGYRRENIDPAKTCDNYNLKSCDVRTRVLEAVDIHEATAGRKIRSDANVLCDWVVTLPGDCPIDKARDFFSASLEFLENRYGADNVVGGYVHVDETTPHMHVPVIPMRDRKLNAKAVINRADLKTFHENLARFVDERLGFHVSVELDSEKHLEKALGRSVEAQKEFKAAKDAAKEEIGAEIESQRAELAEIKREVAEEQQRLECLRRGTNELKSEIATERGRIDFEEITAETLGSRKKTSEIDSGTERIEKQTREFERGNSELEEERNGLRERIAALHQRIGRCHEAIRLAKRGLLERIPERLRERALELVSKDRAFKERMQHEQRMKEFPHPHRGRGIAR